MSNSTPTNDPRDPSGQWAERHERGVGVGKSCPIDPAVRSNPVKFVRQQDLAEIDQMLLKCHLSVLKTSF